jgi:hypothetical protein
MSLSRPSILKLRTPASTSAARFSLWLLSLIDSTCFSCAMIRPWLSLTSSGRRQACEQSPRLALRPVCAWLMKHWPL